MREKTDSRQSTLEDHLAKDGTADLNLDDRPDNELARSLVYCRVSPGSPSRIAKENGETGIRMTVHRRVRLWTDNRKKRPVI